MNKIIRIVVINIIIICLCFFISLKICFSQDTIHVTFYESRYKEQISKKDYKNKNIRDKKIEQVRELALFNAIIKGTENTLIIQHEWEQLDDKVSRKIAYVNVMQGSIKWLKIDLDPKETETNFGYEISNAVEGSFEVGGRDIIYESGKKLKKGEIKTTPGARLYIDGKENNNTVDRTVFTHYFIPEYEYNINIEAKKHQSLSVKRKFSDEELSKPINLNLKWDYYDEYKIFKNKKNIWVGAALVPLFTSAVYFWSSYSNYEKYKVSTSNDEATKLHSKIITQNKLGYVTLGMGLTFGIVATIPANKMKKWKRDNLDKLKQQCVDQQLKNCHNIK